jgi:Zn-dependent protease with chaperone function/Tfp pilus assembly major pilin PilA
MDALVYPRERTLGTITLVLGIIAWLVIIVGTIGGALVAMLIGFVLYLFAQSALIAHIKGNGVQISDSQFPDLYAQFTACCARLQIDKEPAAYVLGGNGAFNAFATQFLGARYVVLLSDVVDAMDEHPEGVRFYIGHELGHLRMKHLTGTLLRWPVLWLPLLGPAYSRARETTCDLHGRACCASAEGAARALGALAAGAKRWKALDLAAYFRQVQSHRGFWASFHELVGGYPWIAKRVARVVDPHVEVPARNPLAYVVSAFVPYGGRVGSGSGLLVSVAIIGILAAVALPAYQDYTARAQLTAAYKNSTPAREALARYYESRQQIPGDLATASIPETLAQGATMSLDGQTMVLTVTTRMGGELLFSPSMDAQNHVVWACSPGSDLRPAQVPSVCR